MKTTIANTLTAALAASLLAGGAFAQDAGPSPAADRPTLNAGTSAEVSRGTVRFVDPATIYAPRDVQQGRYSEDRIPVTTFDSSDAARNVDTINARNR